MIGRVRAGLRAVAVAVAACLAAGCAATPDAMTAARREPPGIVWTGCEGLAERFQCAKVPVPLDWSEPDGPRIELAVIRHLASRPQERIGSMFMNPGGPGQSGVELVRGGGDDFDAWGGGRFDVIGWDPRGTEGSSPVRCFPSEAEQTTFWQGVSIPSTTEQSKAYEARAVDLARRCGEVSGKLLSHISTADTARDLDALRALVGDEQLTYVGLSYGSMIGQTYLNLFPGRTRAMMLDGIVDAVEYTTSAETRTADNVSSADEVFAQFMKLCQEAAPGRCALAGHGEPVTQRVEALFAMARRAPIPAPHADPPGTLSYGDLQMSTFNPLRLPLTWPQFAEDLDAAAAGDASALLTSARQMQSPAGFAAATTSAAISCVDGSARTPVSQWPQEIARFTAAGKLWGAVLGWWLWAPCAANWPADDTDRYAGPWNAPTKTPVLLISARHDPGTPYHNAQATEKLLGNAVLLTLNGYGHPSYQVPSACVDQARERYLVDLVTPPKGTVCQPDQQPFG
ncbi:hydrolase [Catellatospora methionotrophica]|uniref:Hydrolase n=1 Tax=Catellatospora methionotrophica TaxID=121620 RepID=A0A8J3PL73_9ACTN|nr:alpha/beta hydrolase [Catellatospora methionotrophica]GIG19226.1 hydrolase [Catellatospora methionotrophica]